MHNLCPLVYPPCVLNQQHHITYLIPDLAIPWYCLFKQILLPKLYNVFNVQDIPQHRIKRKLIGRAVTDQEMRAFEPVMIEQVGILLRKFFQASSVRSVTEEVNMTPNLKHLSYDIVGYLAFGYPLKLQDDESSHFIIDELLWQLSPEYVHAMAVASCGSSFSSTFSRTANVSNFSILSRR